MVKTIVFNGETLLFESAPSYTGCRGCVAVTDRVLLELAAKAAGIVGVWVDDFGSGDYYYQGNYQGILYEDQKGGSYVWNPLTDDGDALRLAVKLGLWITIDDTLDMTADAVKPVSRDTGERPKHFTERFKYQEFGDRYVATRRAITRAAAEIGKAMP